MCGIAGIFNMNGSQPVDPALLKRMAEYQHHRGSDEFGIYVDDDIGLAHNRLSIVDLNSGTQPIHNEDQTKWIIFNGEIYNYPELRRALERSGHRFYTQTDTEVMIHLYEDKGPSMLRDLNGQFSIAIWDSVKKELFLARDRLGILPLHYTHLNGSLIFASELKAIIGSGLVTPRIDPFTIDQVFTLWSPLPGRTAFVDINELPPGHYMTVSQDKLKITEYWDLSFEPTDERNDSLIIEDLKGLISDALRIRLRADVPVASYLSGGLDSSGLTTLINRELQNGMVSFGIGFEDPDYDERQYQELVAEDLNLDHTLVNTTTESIARSFPDAVWHSEKPILRTAPVPLFDLSGQVNRDGFKVVVTGEGADEIFGGYNIFREAKARSFVGRMPGSKLRPRILEKLYPYIFSGSRARSLLSTFFAKGLDDMDDPFFSHRIRWNTTSRIKGFFSGELRDELKGYDCIEDLTWHIPSAFKSWDLVSRAQYLEMKLFMSNYLLSSQGDRMAMAHSVEIRPAYLDHRIVEFMGRVPSRRKIPGLKEKHLLKKAYSDLLPAAIIDRPKKPYRAPIDGSLADGANGYLDETLSEDSLIETGFFDHRKVNNLVSKVKGKTQISEVDGMALAGIISTQILYDKYVKSFPDTPVYSLPEPLLFDHRTSKY